MDTVLSEMFDCLAHGDSIYLPSQFWEHLNKKNVHELEVDGYERFKQTVARNYFTWIIGRKDSQFRYLLKHIDPVALPWILGGLWHYDSSSGMSRRRYAFIVLFTRLIWQFAEYDMQHLLKDLEEPLAGAPLNIRYRNKLISQDLANTALEYYSIREHFAPNPEENPSICELGAGYGRDAFFFLKALPRCRYIIVDIPPALYIAQRYLSELFPNKRVFEFRCFDSYEAVESEFSEADIAFLLPHQAALLPDKSVDLFVNISSLHEMRPDQINAYMKLIDRLTRGYFYSKQWFKSVNPHDGVVIRAEDYPIPSTWRQLYFRPAKVQTMFFESMYTISSSHTG
jgi:putative sugar O-methyltransferase